MDIVITKFKKEQTKKVEKHFSNLKFLSDFVDDPSKDLKVSESGKKANMRLPKIGKIISVSLESEGGETSEAGGCVTITVSAPAIDSTIKFICDYFPDDSKSIISVHGEFNPILGPINGFLFRTFVESRLENIIREKIEKVAN